MPTIAETLTMLAKKAGLPTTDLEKVISENEALTKLNAPEDIYKGLEKNLLTVDQAKHNSDLKSYYTRQALDTVDAKITEVIGEYQIDPSAINATNSSYERIKLLSEAIRQKEAEKVGAATGDKKVLQDEIKKLNDQVLQERAKWKQDLEALTSNHTAEKRDMLIRSQLAAYNYSKQFDRDIAQEAAWAAFNKKLSSDGGKLVLADNDLKLVNAKDQALNFTINNQEVKLKDYMDKFMAETKLLQTNDAPSNPPIDFNQPPPQGVTQAQANALSAIEKQMADMGMGQ